MTALTLLAAGKLTASLADRVLSGMLLPFNQEGRTNLGRLTASADSALTLAAVVPLTIEHKPTDIIGKAIAVEATPEGLRASFKVLETPAGDAALLEVSEGLRACLSIEVEPIVTRAGRIVSGTVAGASLVARPAFPAARLVAAEDQPVPDLGDTPADPPTPDVVINGAELDDVTAVEVTPERITITTDTPAPAEADKKEPIMTAALVQNPALVAPPKPAEPEPVTKSKLFAQLAEYGTTRLEAALSDIVPANTPGVGIQQPQYVGELWDGVEYERKFLNAFTHAVLTSYNVKGWKWNNKPVVGKYTGNKTDVPSGPLSTVEVNGVLQRFAGAHDIDRIYTDFGDAEFWAAYFAAMAESYAKETDLYIRDIVREVPTAGNGQRVHLLTGVAPANVPTALWQIVEGCAKILNDINTLPTHAYVTVDYWKPILYTPVTQVLTYLNAALGLRDGTLEGQGGGFKIIPVPVGSLTAAGGGGFTGKTMVCHKNAISIRELGGGAPIRVNAIDIAKGGVDEGLFGYVGTLIEEPKGIVLFDAPAAS